MKKSYGLFLFLIILSFFLFNNNIKAKAALINTNDVIYMAEVKNNTTCFEDSISKKSISIKKGEVINIYWETEINKVNYGVFYLNDVNYYIKLNDIKVLDSEYDLSKATKLDNPIDYYVYPDSGTTVNMYSGPSGQFTKLKDNIPTGTILSITYISSDKHFGYTTYNGASGWVYIFIGDDYGSPYRSGLMNYGDKLSLKVIGDTKLYKSYLNINPKVYEDIIPNGTIVDSVFSFESSTNNLYYVSYNGKKGWILDSNMIDLVDPDYDSIICTVIDSSYNTINNDVKFSNDINSFVTNNTYTNVSIGTKFDANCIYKDPNYGDFYLTTINGENGWINDLVDETHKFKNIEPVNKDTYIIKNDCNFINDYRKIIGSLKAGEQVTLNYENNDYAYVNGDKVFGWIKKDNIELDATANNDNNYIVEYINNNLNGSKYIIISLAVASVILTLGFYFKKNNRNN